MNFRVENTFSLQSQREDIYKFMLPWWPNMFKYEHYNSLILRSSTCRSCGIKNSFQKFPSFDISATLTVWDGSICGWRHWKIDLVAQRPTYPNTWKREGIEEKFNSWNLYSLDATKSWTLEVLGFRNWLLTVSLPIIHFKVLIKKWNLHRKKTCLRDQSCTIRVKNKNIDWEL